MPRRLRVSCLGTVWGASRFGVGGPPARREVMLRSKTPAWSARHFKARRAVGRRGHESRGPAVARQPLPGSVPFLSCRPSAYGGGGQTRWGDKGRWFPSVPPGLWAALPAAVTTRRVSKGLDSLALKAGA